MEIADIRKDFPILKRNVGKFPLVYLDNAATTQKPHAVIDALNYFYEHTNANIHRGIHRLSQEATDAYEAARDSVQRFMQEWQRGEIDGNWLPDDDLNGNNQIANNVTDPNETWGLTVTAGTCEIMPWR